MILSLILCLTSALAQPIAREWRDPDRVIHETCKGVDSAEEILTSYELQSLVVVHSTLLTRTTLVGLDSIRVQAEHDRLTSEAQVEAQLRILSATVLESMHRIEKQAKDLERFARELEWFKSTAMEITLTSHRPQPFKWRRLCHSQAKETSAIAWSTYQVLLTELTRLQRATEQLDAVISQT